MFGIYILKYTFTTLCVKKCSFVSRRKSNRISTTATFISVGSRLSNGICVSHAFCFMIESGAYLIFLDYFDKMSISYLASGDFYQYWKTFLLIKPVHKRANEFFWT